MFTGIITNTGTIAKISRTMLTVHSGRGIVQKLKKGDSIAVDGMCLTVTAKNGDFFSADVMAETLKRTNFGTFKNGDSVNLEMPATPKSFLSGHIVQGHIDAVGTVKEIKKEGNQFTLSISILRRLSRYVVSKGSITVNGVSLTVIEAGQNSFSVGIIPHTWESTVFHTLQPKSLVNIEVDVLAKYVERFTAKRHI